TDSRRTPVQVSGLSGITGIAAGSNHAIALRNDGAVWAWGNNSNGQLGDGTTDSRHTPVQVSGLSGIIAISVGVDFSVALKSDGTVWAWGDHRGQHSPSTVPVQIPGLSD
ncbi:hypothetical protein RZS08_60525, partial [Arthrospira platensis SPKY1]|nr:hypothetical protein [Arthrospira platensis SPKY1]